jgi:glyoxylase-like metal-dependent hydrolase (beta-lactamase superfamily II)
MNGPEMMVSREVAKDTYVLGAYLPIPGFGILPVNAYLIDAAQPVLVDTGLAALGEAFMQELNRLIDPARLRWIWITHADPDHLGNLQSVLAAAPDARVVTTYLGMGKMGMHGLPAGRMYLLNPGQELNVSDRALRAVTLPTFDAPETTGIFDPLTESLFSADCFGALMQAPAETASDIQAGELKQGCIAWATIDAPWLHSMDPEKFGQSLEGIRQLKAKTVLSAHLPPAYGICEQLLGYLAEAPTADRFEGPDQVALMQMMAA